MGKPIVDNNLSDVERGKLVSENTGLVHHIAKKYPKSEDLTQDGMLGLVMASRKFDPEQGFKFSTYAVWWIKSFINRGLIKRPFCVNIPEKKIRTKTDRMKRIVSFASYPVSFDSSVIIGGEEVSLYDSYPDDGAEDPVDVVYGKERKRIVLDVIGTLPERARSIIRGRMRGMTLTQIGEFHGITRERVRQIELKARRDIVARLETRACRRAN